MNLTALLTRSKEQIFPAVRAASQEKGRAPEGCGQKENRMLNIFSDSEKGNAGNGVERAIYQSTASFEKKLRWMIENPSKDGLRMTITPKMAEVMLAWNSRNRPAAEAIVKKYADLMRNGRWHYTGEAVIFSKQRLIDGQHRLAACMLAEVPFDALVVFGAPDEAFAFIDVGKTRTASNIFAIHGVKNHAVMAAATQWVIGYEEERIGTAAKGIISKDHAWLYEQYLAHVGLQDSAWVAGIFAKAKIVSPSMMVAIHYICARKNRSQADEFFRKVGEGIGFAGKKDPAYKLHKFFVDAAIADERVGRRTAAALTIKAWNASRRDRDVGALRFAADEAFPRVI